MHSFIVLALAPLALANDLSKRSNLLPRQGNDAFIPETSGFIINCQTPCGRDCLNPNRGDICCAEGYGCPGGNFCLTKGYCCPNGDDPATCARQLGVTLPAGFTAGQVVSSAVSSSAATPFTASNTIVAPSPSSTPASPTPASVTPVETSSATALFPTPVTNATLPPPSTATSTSAAGGSIVPFTGGATRFAVDGVVAAIVVGAIGLLM